MLCLVLVYSCVSVLFFPFASRPIPVSVSFPSLPRLWDKEIYINTALLQGVLPACLLQTENVEFWRVGPALIVGYKGGQDQCTNNESDALFHIELFKRSGGDDNGDSNDSVGDDVGDAGDVGGDGDYRRNVGGESKHGSSRNKLTGHKLTAGERARRDGGARPWTILTESDLACVGVCAVVRRLSKGGGGAGSSGMHPLTLLDPAAAKPGTSLHRVCEMFVRIEYLSYLFFWAKSSALPGDVCALHRIEAPRLRLNFEYKKGPDGVVRLW